MYRGKGVRRRSSQRGKEDGEAEANKRKRKNRWYYLHFVQVILWLRTPSLSATHVPLSPVHLLYPFEVIAFLPLRGELPLVIRWRKRKQRITVGFMNRRFVAVAVPLRGKGTGEQRSKYIHSPLTPITYGNRYPVAKGEGVRGDLSSAFLLTPSGYAKAPVPLLLLYPKGVRGTCVAYHLW